ncbi:MAG: hypothetical protein LBF16_11640 [Pseudomonadales bacterium]|jgi:site-specific recombinase XerC|nr:hypothetical protein [Pseudomonadales bacterium]
MESKALESICQWMTLEAVNAREKRQSFLHRRGADIHHSLQKNLREIGHKGDLALALGFY